MALMVLPIQRFPPELLVMVFTQLRDPEKTLCEMACSYWRSIIKQTERDLTTTPDDLLRYGAREECRSLIEIAKLRGATYEFAVAMFYFDWEGDPLPVLIIAPQEVDPMVYEKIKKEFEEIDELAEKINIGIAPDSHYENPEEAKKEYTETHRGETYYSLYTCASKGEIIEFLCDWNEFEGLTEDNLYSFIFESPALDEGMRMTDTGGIFVNKHSLYDYWSLGMDQIPTEIKKLL